jgi:hypothetical protein
LQIPAFFAIFPDIPGTKKKEMESNVRETGLIVSGFEYQAI